MTGDVGECRRATEHYVGPNSRKWRTKRARGSSAAHRVAASVMRARPFSKRATSPDQRRETRGTSASETRTETKTLRATLRRLIGLSKYVGLCFFSISRPSMPLVSPSLRPSIRPSSNRCRLFAHNIFFTLSFLTSIYVQVFHLSLSCSTRWTFLDTVIWGLSFRSRSRQLIFSLSLSFLLSRFLWELLSCLVFIRPTSASFARVKRFHSHPRVDLDPLHFTNPQKVKCFAWSCGPADVTAASMPVTLIGQRHGCEM